MFGRTPSAGRKSCRGVARVAALVALALGGAAGEPARALEVAGYSPTVNDRFVSGFPGSPVPNTSGSFVGAGLDWSGVGWSAADATKGFGFITPQHYLVARHYGGATTIVLRGVAGTSGTLRSVTQASVTDTRYGVVLSGSVGDLSLGRLTAAMPASWQIARYAVLDLNSGSSDNDGPYTGQTLLVYGRGASGAASPRIGATFINGQVLSGADSYVTSSRSVGVRLEGGDSGSPIFIPWNNPVGGWELTILGNNVGYNTFNNFYNAIGNSVVMGALNGLTTPDGFAVKVRGNLNATWTGGSSTLISNGGNWTSGTWTDKYVGFNAGGATSSTITIDEATTLRGMSVGAGLGATQGFTFSGSNTLTIGRGGLTNYTSLGQTFSAPLSLGDHQYWDVGSGGVTAGAIATNGKLLEIAGNGTARITGAVSGSGGLALSGQRLELTGSSTYTGATWGHAGTISVAGDIASSSGVVLDAGATLAGAGRVSTISGAGMVGPGTSPGILTATSVTPAGGLDFSFEFTKTGAPLWATGTASGNDVLRLTATATPFATALNASNAIDVYLGVTSLSGTSVFQGGLYTDGTAAFLSQIQNATFTYYVLGDGAGTAKTYNGQGYYLLDTNYWPAFERVDRATVTVAAADFAGGTVLNGRVMQLTVVPEPGAMWLALAGLAVVAVAARRSGYRQPGGSDRPGRR